MLYSLLKSGLAREYAERLARGDYRGLRGPGLVKRGKPTKLARALLEAVRKLG